MKNTVVVNLFAGPGAGKSTCAWEIASKLKKLGYVAEYVSEYAKELVWDEKYEMLDGTLEHQSELLKEQQHRQNRLMGKVDFIVTDSPTILNLQYLKESAPDYVKNCIKEYKEHNNFSLFIKRG
ncbi:MAG: AAA family ATPase, partial [Acutalibacteraceae bacterium]